jgi:diketogulonate reductase-like aldo/keto reductase
MTGRTVTLNTGAPMPWLGLGVWQVEDGDAARVVREAVESGYRSIDTAKVYGNERGVGEGIRTCGVPRERLFVTTKVWNEDVRAGRVEAALDDSLKALGLGYVDLYLVHWPIRGRIAAAWKAMEALHASGRARAVGVSNHMEPHLDELLASARVVPAVNQVEFHPYLQSPALVERCRKHGIRVEAWSPLGQGKGLLDDPTLGRIAGAHRRTAAQVALRWNIQREVVTIPKTVRKERMAENAALADFELSVADMAAIAALDRGRRFGPDPMNFGF